MCNKVNIYVYIFFFLLIVVFTSCGSKKKTVEVNKSTYRENKDLSVFQQKSELSVITFTKDASEMIIEPNVPDKPLIIGNDTIIGAKSVIYRKSRVDSTASTNKTSNVEMSDKGEVYSSTKTKNIDKEKKVQVLWWQWVIIIGGILIGVLYLKARGRKLF